MKLVCQPNIWSCTAASLAMLLGLPYDQMIQELGHDGSELILPGTKKPWRGFTIQELVDVALQHQLALVRIEMEVHNQNNLTALEAAQNRVADHMAGNHGLIVGRYAADQCHMVAWDGERVFDPMGEGRVYSFGDSDAIVVETFYRAIGIKSG